MAVTCSWADAQVHSDAYICSNLPPEILDIIVNKTGDKYLDALAFASLIPSCTDRLLTLYEPLIVEITARWLHRNSSGELAPDIDIFSSLARILPLVPYLKPRLQALLESSLGLKSLRRTGELNLVRLTDDLLLSVLLAWFRLLTYDVDSFAFIISPLQLSSIFGHARFSIRCLAIQCMNLQMKMSDALSQKVLANHVPDGSTTNAWEGRQVDYRWLKLFEEERWKILNRDMRLIRSMRPQVSHLMEKGLTRKMLSPQTAELVDILIPRSSVAPNSNTAFVRTLTTSQNLQLLAQALLESHPILLTGEAGSGKTSLINEAAAEMNKSSSMVTMHLNEQTDAKSLIGLYTASAAGGSFVWQPGVVTKAMQEGNWVVIEDIDKAPPEVIGVLLPIIEKAVQLLPNRREQIRAADGFRILATMRRSDESVTSQEYSPRSLLGSTIWRQVQVQELTEGETATVLREKFSAIGPHLSMILRVIFRVRREYEQNRALRNLRTEATGLRTILKWCHRINSGLKSFGSTNIHKAIPESFQDEIFMDALDCFAGHLPTEATRFALAESIAQEMHISPQRRDYCFRDYNPSFHESASEVKIGRAFFPKMENRTHIAPKAVTDQPFSSTRHARKTMESMLAAMMLSEPLLLVGETGIGKTALVQRLARAVNQKLTVINLSQQSESSDLLGGFKPVTTRSLALPLVDIFDDLFEDTFLAERNQSFQSSVTRCVAKQNWRRLLLLWQEAMKKVRQKFHVESSLPTPSPTNEQPMKKRRIFSPKDQALRQRWTEFSTKTEAFNAQLSRGDSNFAFAFVEGKIVDAVRNGEWILFDEINLASPDTLDSITSLLRSSDDGLPFLLLPEAGNLDRVIGHPSLRIFAAMNPATDAGKKDLAPGLRARFTELFIRSPDDDLQDLISLINTYLRSLLDLDERAASDLAQLYLQIKKLNEESRLTDGAGDRPHFSIRSLVRCLMYIVQNAPYYGLRRAMYEGAAMSFLTVLSTESGRSILSLLDQNIFSSVKNARSLRSQMHKMPTDGQYVNFEHHWLQKGPLTPQQRPQYIITPFVQRNLLNLARATSMKRFPILLQGPTSSGKTSMVEHLARVSGHHFVRINNHEHTDLQEYLGFYASDDTGKLQYKEGVLVQALREGHWIVLDELNLAPTDVLEALNRLLDDNRELLVPESQEVVKPHVNFMLFATQNPAGAYGGRKRLSRAFRNRFLEIHFDDIPEDELETILRERTQIAPSFCERIVSVYKRLALLRQSTRLFEQRNSFITLRDLFRWALRRAENWQQLANNGFMLLAERVRDPAERQAVKSTIEDVLKVKVNDTSLYDTYTVPELSEIPDTIVWTPAMRRLFVLVSEAVAHDEPVLLIGETGCGKTQVCQIIARAAGRPLQTYNANANTEIGDLIGAQRPTRNKGEIERELWKDIQQLLNIPAMQVKDAGLSLDDLIDKFEKADISNVNHDFVQKIRRQIAYRVSLFQWTDGNLVRAMKDGDHFLLDEISLAEDAVLERLNSLLEPERTLLLAEKGPIDSSIIAAPGFQFLATMNPGGDYGKRELSAALRNRFTEIWVPPLTDAQDILPILQSNLYSSIPNAAQVMIQFAKWFKASFENSTTSSISLRNLLSWSDFIRATTYLTSYESLVHGAAMVYIDTLGANPSGMLTMNVEVIAAAKQQCLEKLGELLQHDTSAIYHRRRSLSIGATVQIGCFHIHADPASSAPHDIVFDAPTTLQNGMSIIRALQVSKAILLEGNPGAGKTALITALAHLAGKSLVRINLSDQTDLMDLFGADVPSEGGEPGSFSWRDGPLLQAMQSGAWVLLDEMNLASQSILEGLNSCLDHRQEVYISELDRTFHRHPNFMVFAAQNAHHKGGGRKGLPASFVNRFTVVYTEDFRTEDLAIICQRKFPTVTSSDLANVLTSFSELKKGTSQHHNFQNVSSSWDVNLRDINRWLQLSTQNWCVRSPIQYLDIVIGRRLRTAEERVLLNEVLNMQPRAFPHTPLYHNLTPESYQVGSALLNRNTAIANSSYPESEPAREDLPSMEALMLCVSQAWPGILVGSAGSRKSELIRNLAGTIGTTLLELPMNADTDIMDIIGGFEQYDPQLSLSALRQKLCQLVKDHIARISLESRTNGSWNIIMDLYERVVIDRDDIKTVRPLLATLSEHSTIFATYLTEFDASCAEARSSQMRFQWVDGALVEAVERGYWVVLENANLCSASVLDRLNSLLEPDGSLIVSEQHNLDGHPRLIKPHEDFRIFLTMDPRHGELSPAMRNRSLEIYVQSKGPDDLEPRALIYSATSEISRLRLLVHIDLKDVSSELRTYISRIGLDHLSLREHMSSHHWQTRLSGLLTLEVVNNMICRQSLPPELITQIRHFYTMLAANGYLRDGQVLHQPIRPILNQHVLTDEYLPAALNLAWLTEYFIRLAAMQNQLEEARERVRHLKTSEMTILESSIYAEAASTDPRHKSQRIAVFLELLGNAIREALQKALRLQALTFPKSEHTSKLVEPINTGEVRPYDFSSTSAHPRTLLNNTIDFLSDFISLASHTKFEQGIWQVYLQIGHKLVSDTQFEVSDLSRGLSKALASLEQSSPLRYGRSLLRMWDFWRPITAATSAHLEQLDALEAIADRFDNILVRVPGWTFTYADVRVKLLRAWEDVLSDRREATTLVRKLELTVLEMESAPSLSDSLPAGYFAAEFEYLCQILDLHDDIASPPLMATENAETILLIKAGRKTRLREKGVTNSPVPGLLSKISRFSGSENPAATTQAWRRTSIVDLISKVNECQYQPLSSLDSLSEDIMFMVDTVSSLSMAITSSHALRLQSEVALLLQQILSAHKDLFGPSFDCSEAIPKLIETSGPSLAEKVSADHYFRTISSSLLKPAAIDLTRDGLNEEEKLIHTGSALVRVCVAFLYLFVPDQPHDPALSLVVQRERYDKRLKELQVKLQALYIFQKRFSGSTRTMEVEMVKDEMIALGQRPPLSGVCRPQETQLPLLAAEFSNLISMINKTPETILIWDRVHTHVDEDAAHARHREASLFQQNIARTVQRLSNGFRAYADLTVPVVRTLQCLDLAVDLVMLRDRPVSYMRRLIEYISTHTPFLGAKPVAMRRPHFAPSILENCSMAIRLLWLDHFTLRYAASRVSQTDGPANQGILMIIDQFYQEWKLQLAKGQQLEARQSKYYSYRGEDDGNEMAVQAEMQEIFPDFSRDSDSTADEAEEPEYEPKTIALKLSKLLIMVNSNTQQQRLEKLVFTGLELLHGVNKHHQVDFSPIGPESMLPGALLLLQRRWKSLSGIGTSKKLNIYKATDLVEVRRISEIARRIKLRIEEILVIWPEHALLHDIYACCRDILQFKINDPLAKVLTKAEKLHQLSNEWQAVASRELSVTALLDQLTRLIVSWRKLELESWDGLLDLEKQKCQDDATSWFFIAYEVVIAIPFKIMTAGESVSGHADELVATLENFLKNTASGQFSERLQLIEGLCSFISRFVKQYPAILKLTSSITNLLQHHNRYREVVECSLQAGRAKLELDLKEQIRTTSWKDTNVSALRESARRSHHKLFKIVRKYRTLLLQPIREHNCERTFIELACTTPSLRAVRAWALPPAAARALKVCQQELLGWQSRPIRLQNAVGGAASMCQLYLSRTTSFKPHKEVNIVTGDLSEMIKELKSSTPARQTEDNRDLVQHLKTRKRRLLADVLKTLRHMGVHRNLSMDELSKQSSTALVLSTTPHIAASNEIAQFNFANDLFHGFLDYMPQIRATLREHSDELTGSEVNRCVSLAEGLLLILRNQRALISPTLASLKKFNNLLQKVARFQRDESDPFVMATHIISSDLEALMQQLHWLPDVLDLGRRVLGIQAEHSKLDFSIIMDLMESRSNDLRSLYLQLQKRNHLPPGLSTKLIIATSQRAHKLIDELRRNLSDVLETQPHTAYLLEQVVWWTERQSDDIDSYTNGTDPHSIADVDQSIREAIDKVFVALQDMTVVQSGAVKSPQDAAWLTSSDATATLSMKALCIEKITATFDTALNQIHLLDDASFPLATSLFIIVTPIIEQYYCICRQVLEEYAALHRETCRYSNVLAKAFLAISSEGFCSPLNESAGKEEQSGQIEQGTGLGEGEGAEDISKDVGKDEDLSELAQNGKVESRENKIDDVEDAVDMADGDLEGSMDESGENRVEREEGYEGDEVEENGDVEEETGSVDDLDPSAVDEKLWNDLQNENEKEIDHKDAVGQASNEQAAANEKQDSKRTNSVEESGERGAEDDESSVGEEDETLGREEHDQLDPHVQEEETLGLPEDMQLDGGQNTKDELTSVDGLDELSDVENTEDREIPPERAKDLEEDGAEVEAALDADAYNDSQDESDGEDSKGEPAEDQSIGKDETDADRDEGKEDHITRHDGDPMNADDAIGEDTGMGGKANEEAEPQEKTSPGDQSKEVSTREDQRTPEDAAIERMDGSVKQERPGTRRERSDFLNDRKAEVFKKLGDILDQWHQRREIRKPSEALEKRAASADIEMADADLEHVEDDADQGDTQALDAATKDQAKALDQSRALLDDEVNPDEGYHMPDADDDESDIEEQLQNESLKDFDPQMGANGERSFNNSIAKGPQTSELQIREGTSSQPKFESEDVQDVDEQFSAFQLASPSATPLVSLEESSRLWTQHSSSIHPLSLLLTEQLRLILAPTLATKLRGDFRTGKRLNIKRIIPYIASGYKRDKIWMRRSVPSKRNYQIMVAVDNSKSMAEGGAAALALQSLALLCKSLTMLEVGEICVVGFGDEEHVRVAQPFAQTFTAESGPRIFRYFGFHQTATDVRMLVAESIALFREARAKSTPANTELWQLELIISDGICEDHDTVRRLVRQAAEERIMIVFVIVDSASASGSSILDLQRASYEPDTTGGEPKLTVKRYLDSFPFPYYLIVRDVHDLPGVLATALKGWFAEVVDVQG